MDQHIKFRMESMKQGSSSLLRTAPARFRVNTTPMLFRSKCKPEPLAETTENSESSVATPPPPAPTPAPASEIGGPQPIGAKEGPHVQKQVKQLQFWLKVFSRFCQDETTCE